MTNDVLMVATNETMTTTTMATVINAKTNVRQNMYGNLCECEEGKQ